MIKVTDDDESDQQYIEDRCEKNTTFFIKEDCAEAVLYSAVAGFLIVKAKKSDEIQCSEITAEE